MCGDILTKVAHGLGFYVCLSRDIYSFCRLTKIASTKLYIKMKQSHIVNKLDLNNTLHFNTCTMSIPSQYSFFPHLYYGPSPSSCFQHTSRLHCFDRSCLLIYKCSHCRKTNCLCDQQILQSQLRPAKIQLFDILIF